MGKTNEALKCYSSDSILEYEAIARICSRDSFCWIRSFSVKSALMYNSRKCTIVFSFLADLKKIFLSDSSISSTSNGAGLALACLTLNRWIALTLAISTSIAWKTFSNFFLSSSDSSFFFSFSSIAVDEWDGIPKITTFFFLLSRSACSDRIELVIFTSNWDGFGTDVAVFFSPSFSALESQQLLLSRVGALDTEARIGGEGCRTITWSESLFTALVRLEILLSVTTFKFLISVSKELISWSLFWFAFSSLFIRCGRRSKVSSARASFSLASFTDSQLKSSSVDVDISLSLSRLRFLRLPFFASFDWPAWLSASLWLPSTLVFGFLPRRFFIFVVVVVVHWSKGGSSG